jgi:hypothetical protein
MTFPSKYGQGREKIWLMSPSLFHQWCCGEATLSSPTLETRLQILDFIDFKEAMEELRVRKCFIFSYSGPLFFP